MKSKIIKLFSYIIEILTEKEENEDNNDTYCITDNDLIIYINKVNNLIINSLEDILKNKEKYNILRNYKIYKESINYEKDNYNILLYEMFNFLIKNIIKEPIKSNFSPKIKNFLLNILLPIIITNEDEINFVKKEPEIYNEYINDIISKHSIKSFRSSVCLLIKTICQNFDEIKNYILSFHIEMFNYIICDGNIKYNLPKFNLYLKDIRNYEINNYSDEIKIDYSLLVILIIENNLKNNLIFITRLGNILIDNKEKLFNIESLLIKTKLFK